MKAIVFLLLLCSACFVYGQTGDPFPVTVDRIKNGVTVLACINGVKPDQLADSAGAGFFVNDDGYFITARHVITRHFAWNENGEPIGCIPAAYVPKGGWKLGKHDGKWFIFGKCFLGSETSDIALCKTEDNPFTDKDYAVNWLELNPNIPPIGTLVAFTGFPLSYRVPVTFRGSVAVIDEQIVVDHATVGGNSGGPVYLSDGSVIGFMSQNGVAHTNTSLIVGYVNPAFAIIAFLSEHGISAGSKKQNENH